MREIEIIILEKYESKQSFPINMFQGADRELSTNWQVILVIAISIVPWVVARGLAFRTSFFDLIFVSTAFSIWGVNLAWYRLDGCPGRNK